MLPRPGGIGRSSRRGYESESRASNNPLTAMGDSAARAYNEK
jgi:hypothetical protein